MLARATYGLARLSTGCRKSVTIRIKRWPFWISTDAKLNTSLNGFTCKSMHLLLRYFRLISYTQTTVICTTSIPLIMNLLDNVCRWYESSKVKDFGISKKDLLVAYFLAASTIFEPERTQERIIWAKTLILSRMITSFLNKQATLSSQQKIAILTQLGESVDGLDKIHR